MQICVAVLIDSFVTTRSLRQAELLEKKLKEVTARGTIKNTLDPLLEGLARQYTDEADLSRRLKELFEVGASRLLIQAPLPKAFDILT